MAGARRRPCPPGGRTQPSSPASATMERMDTTGRPSILGPGLRRLTTVGMVLVVSFIAFEAIAVATVLPVVVRHLGGLRLYGWTFSAFMLAQLVGIVVAGPLVDPHRNAPSHPGGRPPLRRRPGRRRHGPRPCSSSSSGAEVQGVGAGVLVVGTLNVLGSVGATRPPSGPGPTRPCPPPGSSPGWWARPWPGWWPRMSAGASCSWPSSPPWWPPPPSPSRPSPRPRAAGRRPRPDRRPTPTPTRTGRGRSRRNGPGWPWPWPWPGAPPSSSRRWAPARRCCRRCSPSSASPSSSPRSARSSAPGPRRRGRGRARAPSAPCGWRLW